MPALGLPGAWDALRSPFTESLVKQGKKKKVLSLKSATAYHVTLISLSSFIGKPTDIFSNIFCLYSLSFISLGKWRKEDGVMYLGCDQHRQWATGHASELFILFYFSSEDLRKSYEGKGLSFQF